MDLTLLEDNLREIYISAPTSRDDTSRLVSNFSGKIYQTSSGWGRLWTWLFGAMQVFYKKDLRAEKLRSAFVKTDEIFQKHLANLQTAIKSYKNYFQLKALDAIPVEEKYHCARTAITNWTKAVGPYFDKYVSNENRDRLHLFNTLSNLTQDQRTDLFMLPLFQQLIDLEGYLHEPLPLAILNKLAFKTPLEDNEISEIKRWIDRHNQNDSPLVIRHFHSALEAFVNITKTEGAKNSDLITLELALAELGLKVFSQKDPAHMKWRESLKPGSKLPFFGRTLTLEAQIGKKPTEPDNTLIFTIKEHAQRIIVIGANQSILNLKKRISEIDGKGIRSARCIQVAPNGDFAIYEKLKDSLGSKKWTSKDLNLDNADLNELIPLANQLKWMIDNEISPKKIDPNFLMFDCYGVLKYTKECITGEFSHAVIEDCVMELTKSNRRVFTELMQRSSLSTHPLQKFYEKIFQMALEDKPCDVSDEAALDDIIDHRVVDRADYLYKEVTKMREHCKNVILTNYLVPDLPRIKNRIREEFQTLYREIKLAGLLWNGMEKDIISNCIIKESLKTR